MKLNFRSYQGLKTKQLLINNNFLIFSIGTNQNAQNWVNVEQALQKLKLDYHKTYNNKTRKIIKNSRYKNLDNLINGTLFFIKPKLYNKQTLIKNTIFKNLNSLVFTTVSVKINNRIHMMSQLKNISSLCYKDNITITYQFLLINLKFSYIFAYQKNPSKQCDSNT